MLGLAIAVLSATILIGSDLTSGLTSEIENNVAKKRFLRAFSYFKYLYLT